ncbi:MAG: hypothetical protein KDC26_12635 [Armatimonadetes bacterium]|nr:hypothetical protein [Armatimonadota bacterium]
MRVLSSNLYPLLREWADDLSLLTQVQTLDEAQFLSWSRKLGVNLQGAVTGDVGEFWKRGWLRSEYIDFRSKDVHMRFQQGTRRELDRRDICEEWAYDGEEYVDPRWHPFRICTVYEIPNPILCFRIQPGTHFSPKLGEAIASKLESKNDQLTDEFFDRSNGIVDLAILLEPIYWPWITSRSVGFSFGLETEIESLRTKHKERCLTLLRDIDVEELSSIHEKLRLAAARVDKNDNLYILLRGAPWDTREKVTGDLGLSLWLRHIAEVLRRGIEEAHDIQLMEEDRAVGWWREGARKSVYGDERPLDWPSYYRSDVLHSLGLQSSICVRWYIEGETEAGYLKEALYDAKHSRIELVNRRGLFAGKELVRFRENLLRDVESEIFSFISVDEDVKANISALKRFAKQELIVGYVSIHSPDFEFANFTIQELVEAAIFFDANDPAEPHDSKKLLEEADWSNVKSGNDFQEKYLELHKGKRRAIKGERWGQALAKLHSEKPLPNGIERPVQSAVHAAFTAGAVKHSFQKENYRIDPSNLSIVKLEETT